MEKVQITSPTDGLIGESFRMARQNLGALLRIVALPSILITGLIIVMVGGLIDPQHPIWSSVIASMLFQFVYLFLISLTFVACAHFVIRGHFPSFFLRLDLGKSEVWFFVVGALVTIISLVPYGLFFFSVYIFLSPMEVPIDENTNATLAFMAWKIQVTGQYMLPIMLGGFVTLAGSLWLLLRLAPFFTIFAVNQSDQLMVQIKTAWGMSKGSTLGLFGTLCGIHFCAAFLVIVLAFVSAIPGFILPLIWGINVGFILSIILPTFGFHVGVGVLFFAVATYSKRVAQREGVVG